MNADKHASGELDRRPPDGTGPRRPARRRGRRSRHPDEFKEVVFETFNRGPNVMAMTPGAGIGLSLVARFAAVHGGRTWVEDNPSGGASFHVLLPDCVADVARQPRL